MDNDHHSPIFQYCELIHELEVLSNANEKKILHYCRAHPTSSSSNPGMLPPNRQVKIQATQRESISIHG